MTAEYSRDDQTGEDTVDETTVVEAAANAAEDVVFARYDRSEVRDIDVTVSFTDGELEVDVYLDAPGDVEQVVEDAVLAARTAADDVVES